MCPDSEYDKLGTFVNHPHSIASQKAAVFCMLLIISASFNIELNLIKLTD